MHCLKITVSIVAIICILPSITLATDSLCRNPKTLVEKTICNNETLRREEALTARVFGSLTKQLTKAERAAFENEIKQWRDEQHRQFSASIGDILPDSLVNKDIHDDLIFGLRDYYLKKRIALFESKTLAKPVAKFGVELFLQMQHPHNKTKQDAIQLFAELIEGTARKTEIGDKLYLGRSADLLQTFPTKGGAALIAYNTNDGNARHDYEFYLFTPRNPNALFTLVPFEFFDETKKQLDGTIESLGAEAFEFDSGRSLIKVKDAYPNNPNCRLQLDYSLRQGRFELDRYRKLGTCTEGDTAKDEIIVFQRTETKATSPRRSALPLVEPARSNG